MTELAKIYLGIDPGKYGAIAALKSDTEEVTCLSFPLAGTDIDYVMISVWLRELVTQNENYYFVGVLEKVGAMPGQGTTSMFNFGFVTGALHGLLAAYGIPRNLVAPQTWKAKVLCGTKQDKDAAIAYCRRVYPEVPLVVGSMKKPSADMAEAICIARYGFLERL